MALCALVGLAVIGCQVSSYQVAVENKSEVGLNIMFSYNGSVYTLKKGDNQMDFTVPANTPAPVLIHPTFDNTFPDDKTTAPPTPTAPIDPNTNRPYPRYMMLYSNNGNGEATYIFKDVKGAAQAAMDAGANNKY